MTELFEVREPCGCLTGRGHYCRPPWMHENEWLTQDEIKEIERGARLRETVDPDLG